MSTTAATAVAAIRGAALRTIKTLHTGLLIDDRWWPPPHAAQRAADYLRRTVQADYYDATRPDRPDAPGVDPTAPSLAQPTPSRAAQSPLLLTAGPASPRPGAKARVLKF